MRAGFFHTAFLPWLLALVFGSALAQEPSSGSAPTITGTGRGSSQLPSVEDVARAQSRAREAMGRIPEPAALRQQYGAIGIAGIATAPKPAAPAADIATLAQKYQTLGRAAESGPKQPDLLVMVSLSMPREALIHLAEQSERSGATLVFRGLKGDSMMKMGEEIKSIMGNRNVSVVVHPPAFQQFSVTRVPVVVIAGHGAGSVLDNGCSGADTFVKVSGDVSLDYALEVIERRSPAWAEAARAFRGRIVRGIN